MFLCFFILKSFTTKSPYDIIEIVSFEKMECYKEVCAQHNLSVIHYVQTAKKFLIGQKCPKRNVPNRTEEVKRLNQILSIDNSKKETAKKNKTRNNGPIEINSILKFFAISILLFGIFMIGSGSYSMYKDSTKEVTNTKPVIYVEQTSEEEILLKVTHDKALSKMTYSWNDEEATEVPSNGRREIETKIQIPTGTNTLKVYASDANGQEIEYKKVYTIEGSININIEPEGNNLKITANGKNQLLYMTYRWDEEEETKVDINSDQMEQTIEIPKGLHKLTVIVVDEKNKTETKEQEVNGVTKPKLEVTTDGSSNFIIKASDEQGIKRVEFIINETEKYMLDLTRAYESVEDRKVFEYAYPLHDGENKLEVTVYNENDITETFKALVNK